MPRIPSQITRPIFYIYPTQDDALNNTEFGATGFFYGVGTGFENRAHYYAVTNAHVVFRDDMENPVIRVNTTDKKYDVIVTSRDNWKRHPDGDDIAVCPIRIAPENMDATCFTKEVIADETFLKDYSIGIGDDVFMIGRFRVHAGREKNLPVIRFGIIAAMNEEGIYNEATQVYQESYLVEMRSISGFSGSPVFVYVNPYSSPRDAVGASLKIEGNLAEGIKATIEVKVLGIQWGQISYKAIATDDSGQKYKVNVDSAMEGVVPIQKLRDLIYSEEMIEMRKKLDEKNKNNRTNEKGEESTVTITTYENGI